MQEDIFSEILIKNSLNVIERDEKGSATNIAEVKAFTEQFYHFQLFNQTYFIQSLSV